MAILIASLLGLGDSAYLTYVHYAHVTIICIGGGCDTVNSSSYAQIFGVPVALLGLLGYLALGALAAGEMLTKRAELRPLLRSALLGLALLSWLYAVYLTYLELFVIYAICTWCVISASDLTLITVLAGLNLWETLARSSADARSGRAAHR